MKKHIGLGVSLGLALLSAVMLMKYAADLRAELGFDTVVTVVAAKEAIPTGSVINRAQIRFRRVPSSFVHPNAVREADLDTVLGRKLDVSLRPDQTLLWNDLTGGRAGADRLSELVQPGLRALTIPVDPRFALSGMVQPSDRVDILLTYTNRMEERVTRTVLQNVLVAAVGTEMGTEAETAQARKRAERRPPNNVTIMVSPEQAELVIYAVDRGKITLTLRGGGDLDLLALVEQDFARLVGEPAPKKAPKKKPTPRQPMPEVIDLMKLRGR